jgi:hypothetical protein
MKPSIRFSVLFLIALPLLLNGITAQAKPKPRPGDVGMGDLWQAPPNDFVFGNHIDTHVQLRLEDEGGTPVSLRGSFYIYFTGDVDPASLLPIARHPRGVSHNEVCGVDNIVCVVGWHMDGVPGNAKFLYHSGINGDDHPVWMVNRAEETSAPAPGMVIPQPGYYSHYHWITNQSNDPRAGTVLAPCDKAKAGQLEDTAPTAANEICQGWFLQIHAVTNFAFEHGGEVIPVYEGEDLRSHLNIVTNYDQEPERDITNTRSGDDH